MKDERIGELLDIIAKNHTLDNTPDYNDVKLALDELRKSVCIGDKMQISVELIEQMRQYPQQRSELVELVDINRNLDGTKVLYFRRVQ